MTGLTSKATTRRRRSAAPTWTYAVEELRSVPRRIGSAGRRSKALALEAVLRAGLLTHIVTDTGAAEALVTRRS